MRCRRWLRPNSVTCSFLTQRFRRPAMTSGSSRRSSPTTAGPPGGRTDQITRQQGGVLGDSQKGLQATKRNGRVPHRAWQAVAGSRELSTALRRHSTPDAAKSTPEQFLLEHHHETTPTRRIGVDSVLGKNHALRLGFNRSQGARRRRSSAFCFQPGTLSAVP